MIEVSIFKFSIIALFLDNSESALYTYDFLIRATARMNAFEFLQFFYSFYLQSIAVEQCMQ